MALHKFCSSVPYCAKEVGKADIFDDVVRWIGVEDCFNGFRILGGGLNRVDLSVETGVILGEKTTGQKHGEC